MALQWIAVDMVSTRVLEELATFEPDYPIRHTLGDVDTITGTLYLDDAPPDWQNVVRAGASVLVAYDDADDALPIQWAGYITLTQPQLASDSVKVSLSTLEGYLARRFVPDFTYAAGTGVYQVITDMVNRWIAGGVGSIPGAFIYTHKPNGDGPALPNDLVLQNSDNATVLDRINALLGQYGGEFTITWAWYPGNEYIVPTLYVGDRVGAVVQAGMAPSVTFESPGAATDVQLPTDYSDGSGANVVTAYSSGSGSVTPYAPPVTAPPDGRPAFEYRYQPEPSQPDTDVLARYASRAVAILGPGAQPLSMVLAREALGDGQQFGSDWNLGDDVGYAVTEAPAFPGGIAGTARVIAVEFTDEASLTPIFAQPEVYVLPEEA